MTAGAVILPGERLHTSSRRMLALGRCLLCLSLSSLFWNPARAEEMLSGEVSVLQWSLVPRVQSDNGTLCKGASCLSVIVVGRDLWRSVA